MAYGLARPFGRKGTNMRERKGRVIRVMVCSMVAVIFSLVSLAIILFTLGDCTDSSTEAWPADFWVSGILVFGDVLPDEQDAITRLSTAIQALSYSIDGLPTVIFIRSPDQHIPKICKCSHCTDVWSEVPGVIGVKERVAGEGLSGLRRGGMIFVSRIGDRKGMLDELLAHEFAHWLCDCGDGVRVGVLEGELIKRML